MAQHYAILSQDIKHSKHGGTVTEIHLIGLTDRCKYVTWIDNLNYNAKNWGHIIKHSANGFILTNLKKKRHPERDDIINADSDPVIAWEHTNHQEVLDCIVDQWREQDRKTKPPTFGDFFSGSDNA